MKPDRIFLAEVRGDECFYFVRLAASGHPGSITSVHAGSCALAIEQMSLMIRESGAGGGLRMDEIKWLLGVVIERLLFTRFYRSDPILSLLMTFGLAMVAEQVLRMIFGAPPLSYSIPPALRGQVALGSFIYSFYRIVLLGVAITCIAGLWVLLQKTSFGRVVRAGVQNPDMVGALGISLQPYMSAVAALGIGLAGLAGVLLAPIYAVHPAMGQEIITPAFVVVVIGGLGSFWGVVAAALLVGLVKGVMVGIGYSAASTAAIYLLMLLVLLFRPRGLFGERITRFE